MTIYIYFLDGRLCEVGAIRRGIRIVRLWWPGLFGVSRHGATTGEACVNSGIFSVFRSVRRPYNTIKLPRGDMDTPLRSLPITGHRNMHFRRLWNGMFDCHRAEITVMEFTGHSLPVHHFVTAPWDFYLVPYCQPSCILHEEYGVIPSLQGITMILRKWTQRIKFESWTSLIVFHIALMILGNALIHLSFPEQRINSKVD